MSRWHHKVLVKLSKAYGVYFLHDKGFTVMEYDENGNFVFGYTRIINLKG